MVEDGVPELEGPGAPAHLLRDVRESFGSVYLTLLSILQGVVLALLFESLMQTGTERGLPFILAGANVFVTVVGFWNEYRMGTSIFRWVTDLRDTLVPFGYATLQAALVWTADVGNYVAWSWIFAILYGAGVHGFQYMFKRARTESENRFALTHLERYLRLNQAFVGLSALAFVIIALVGPSEDEPLVASVCFTVALFINIMYLVRGELIWQRLVKAARTNQEASV